MSAFADRLARAQVARAPLVALAAFLMTLALLPLVRRLELHSDWVELLPDSAPSVRDLHAAQGRVGGTSTLTLVVTSHDPTALRRYAEAIGPRLEAIPHSLGAHRVQWNVRAWQSFVREHRYLYAPLADLRRARDEVSERVAYERRNRTPGFVNLDDPPEPIDDLIRRAREQMTRAEDAAGHFPDGLLMRRDGTHLVIFIRADIRAGDAGRARVLVDRVRSEIAAVPVAAFAPDLTVELAGDGLVALIEHDAIERELVVATLLTIGLCVGAIYGLFRRPRAVVLLGLTLAVPVIATFALARLTVGHLNSSTAFLGSIVIGNGINPGIVWLARYFEERRAGNDVTTAIAATHRGAWAGTFTASLAASLAYGSLMVTTFRGFRDFGIIGATGMVLCWSLTLLVLPSLTALWERWRPLPIAASGEHRANPYGLWFARLARRAPVPLAVGAAALGLAGVVLGVVAIARDPLDYNFRHLTSQRAGTARASALNGLAADIVGRTGNGSAIAVLVQRREDAAPTRASLEDQRDHHRAPFGPVRSMDDLIPHDQAEKIPLLADLRRVMTEARDHASAETRAKLDEFMPPADVRPIGDDDLPESAAALFMERNGTRGRLLFVEERPGAPVWDGRYLMAWSASIRRARTPEGRPPLVVGSAPVYADMIAAIVRDGPRAVLASFLATVVLVLAAFRQNRYRALTLAGLLTGVAWMAGAMAVLGLRLNFLNFVALPITFGIGVDYAVNVVRRYAQEVDAGSGGGHDPIEAAVQETGGAIVVCSLTTIFGYSSLLTSANQALNSFGLVAVIGEITCVLTAVIGVSAVLVLLERRRGEVTTS